MYYEPYTDSLYEEDLTDVIGHGTAVCNAMLKHMERGKILMIRVYSKYPEDIPSARLSSVLKLIYQKVKCKIINISIGIISPSDYFSMKDIICKLVKEGVLVVSSFENAGAMSFPGAYPFVIGVIDDDSLSDIDSYTIIKDKYVNIGCYGKLQRAFIGSTDEFLISGSSLACAHFSGILTNYVANRSQNDKELDNMISKIRENANVQTDSKTICEELNNKRACVFPFNKENQVLLRYEDMLPFSTIDFYDYKYLGNVGKRIRSRDVHGEKGHEHCIMNIDNINLDEYDVFILGHCNRLRGYNIEGLLTQIYKKGIGIFSYDKIQTDDNKFFIGPSLDEDVLMNDYSGKLYHIGKPVIGVFGTGRQQGKYSLQIALRDAFQKKGYNVGQLGTEPSSLLFGMDECFHFGYNSELNLSDENIIVYVNRLIERISLKNNDLIIVGGQSMTIPGKINSVYNVPLRQTALIAGADIDVIILCVSYDDEVDYIRRTIGYLKTFFEIDVIAIAMVSRCLKAYSFGQKDYRQISMEEKENKKIEISREFSLPLFFVNMQQDVEALADLIIEKLS